MRPILPKEEQDESPSSLDSVPDTRSAKRRCVSSACTPCRKRKSKCDGETPACSTCIAVYHTECVYDIDSDRRRKGALKKDIESLRERNGALGVIVAAIRTSTDSEVADIVQQIRGDESLEALAESLKKNVTLSMRADSQSLEGHLSDVIGKPALDQSGGTTYYGHTSQLGLVGPDEGLSVRPQAPSEVWTRVTGDGELVGHLFALYFAWSHPFYTLFSKECFLHDMSHGRLKYCSPLLVNAILATACSYSDRPQARTDPTNPKTAGENFYTEAKRLLDTDDHTCLTTVQALAILGMREAGCGRDSSGFQYAGRCIRMALELGLHLCFSSGNNSSLTSNEIEVRKITFWGCFVSDTAWSICIGRVSSLPRSAISLVKPTIVEQLETMPWEPYVDLNITKPPGVQQPGHGHAILCQFSLLSEIVNDTVFMFYAPRERFTSKKLLDFHSRYTRWYRALPTSLKLSDIPLPQLIILHMYYHTVVLHLFRPFLKLDLTSSSVSPREICTQSANQISALASTYRNIYSFRRVSILVTHILLSSSTIHLLNLPDETAGTFLSQGIQDLHEISTNHPFSNRCLRVVLALAQKWGIELPQQAQEAANASTPESMLSSPISSGHLLSTPYAQGINDIQSRDNQSRSTYEVQHHNSSSNERRLHHYQQQRRESETALVLPITSQHYTDNSGHHDNSAALSGLSAIPTDLFWSPFPDQSMPLQAQTSQDGGPMDITAMLDMRNNDWDQFNRDGFKMALTDPVLNANGLESDWAQV